MINHYPIKRRSVGSGASYGAIAHDEHARKAVQKAMAQMHDSTIGSVLLFLSDSYAHNPTNAIKEAAKAAGTPQIFGCCAMGLLTEQEWLLDVEGAVAMVFPQSMGLHALSVLQQQGVNPSLIFTLTTPNAATMAVNEHQIDQVGSITTDEYGHGPFSVWQSGRIAEQEFSHSAFPTSLKHVVKIADGIKQLSPIMTINDASGHRLTQINQQPAVDNLLNSLPDNLRIIGLEQPFNLLCAISENKHRDSIAQGHYKLHHVVSINRDKQHIYLSGSAKAGHHLFWGIRDQKHSQKEMLTQLQSAKTELGQTPEFSLMFPNIGRGAEFFNGTDQDLEQFKAVFPNTPLIGFYGNGEIAPGHQLSGLIHRYSTVFSIFA